MSIEPDEDSGFASPACLMHEIDPSYIGMTPHDGVVPDIAAWRTNERARLIDERKNLSSADRDAASHSLVINLDRVVGDVHQKAISLYWPFLGEPDLRGWMSAAATHGATCALPVVLGKRQPLVFRTWAFGEPLERGVWNIPIPSKGKEVRPDIVIAPVVGFDSECFRLGYGGGFYDRTLALLQPAPLIIGVGFELQKIETIYPLKHDIPMDCVVTDATIRRGSASQRRSVPGSERGACI